MDPKEVLTQLANRYATCSNYRDRGYLYSWDESLEKTNKPQIVFSTYFERPSKFRFEWRDKNSKGLIWCDGMRNYFCNDAYNSGPDKQSCESPMMAIASATGISRRTAFVAPSLFLDELLSLRRWQWPLIESDITFIRMEKIGEHDCYCIQGSRNTIIWVSTRDFSLRRHRQYMDRAESDHKIILTTEELSPSDKASNYSGDSSLISLHRPQNLVSEQETAACKDLFQGTEGLVDEEIYGRGQHYEEITYEAIEFGTNISPKMFSSIRGDDP